MQSHLTKSAGFLLALGALGAVACGQGITDSGSRHSRVVLSVHSLFGAVLGGNFLSVLDTAHLTIASGGEEQTATRVFGPGDSETTFDVTVKTGSATFSLDVMSNNGTLLYEGETTSTIDGDGFAVNITPRPDTAVLVVYPTPTFIMSDNGDDTFFTYNMRVRNSGSAPLIWRVSSTLPQGVIFVSCVTTLSVNCLVDNVWAPGRDDTISVTFTKPGTFNVTPPTDGIQFFSRVGNLTIPTAP